SADCGFWPSKNCAGLWAGSSRRTIVGNRNTAGKLYFATGRHRLAMMCVGIKARRAVSGFERGDDMPSQFPDKAKAPIALIVEDDADLRELGAALLEETDLRVIECVDAEEAMAVLAREGENVALVFADIRLPGLLNGVDLAKCIKAVWPHISIVVTSGFGPQRALPQNVIYLPKPWLALDVLMQAERAAQWMQRAQRVV